MQSWLIAPLKTAPWIVHETDDAIRYNALGAGLESYIDRVNQDFPAKHILFFAYS
jgi:hypothetical protein